ncbi:response regulator [Aestuariirhabdus sp. Z084]|uniref:response regulator n=1 Tax=Aestuariirhabdus haliotis TaxID=2918751 RepID=UPI00201B3C87|nr:response regulator [Aestuariirhabdus haliotis]MCL6415653.1 response regulator [Aestuariirhabdus haliotis]MCL6419648.1 response regulator [Aestuariirhabdus haliotis]
MSTIHRLLASALFSLLISLSSLSTANVELPAGSFQFNLVGSVDTYVDHSANVSIDELVSQYYINRFSPSRQENLRLGLTDAALWIRIRLLIPAGSQAPYLVVSPPDVSDIQLFQPSQQGWLATQTGANHPYPTRPINSRNFIFPLQLEPGQQVQEVYLRLASKRALNIGLSLASADQLIGNKDTSHWASGLLFGLFLGTAIYNLLCWFSFRDRSFLYLALFMVIGLLFQACWQGLLAAYFPYWPGLQEQVYILCLLLGTAIGSQLIRRFFDTVHTQPLIDQAFRLLVGMPLLSAPLSLLLSDSFPMTAAIFIATLSAIGVFLATIYYIRKGYPCATELFLAQSPFAVAAAINFIAILGLLRIDTQTLNWSTISIASLTLIGESWVFTKRHRLLRKEQKLQQQEQNIRNASAIAKSELLSKISHNLRGPMNGILGMSELLIESSLTPKQKDYVSTIHNSGNDLLNLLNEVQDISKLETGKMTLSDVRFDLHGLIDSCLDQYRVTAEQRGIELISYVQLGIPDSLNGDPVRLKHVLLAMLAQSFRTTEKGEVLLSVTLDSSSQQPRILFSVKDSSEGISEDERNFLLNTRIDTHNFLDSNSAEYSLGLLVSRHVINQMSGTMGIESTSGVGSRYWFILPYVNNDDAALTTETYDFSGVRALVVDDNDTCLKVLTQQCLALGMEVNPCPDGKEALALLRTKAHLNSPFDLVILDHNMPGMTGMELATRIKEDSNFSDLVIVMLTGISNTPSKLISRNAGIARILTKPVANYTLRTTLAEELHNHLIPPREEPATPRNESLLVVTQEASRGQQIQHLAEARQLQAGVAISANQALDSLRSGDYRLVIVDCSSQGQDGFDIAQRIRRWHQSEGLPTIPLIAMSEQSNSDFEQQMRQAQFNSSLNLPLETAQIDELFDRWLA